MRRALVFILVVGLVVVVWLGFSHPLASPLQDGDGQAGMPDLPDLAEELTPEGLAHLEIWLQRESDDERTGAPRRNIFRKAADPAPAVLSESGVSPSPPDSSPLRLVGFIFSGGTMGDEHPQAAVRFEGRMWLVRPGDSVGIYRVERLVVGEEIHLVHADSGEKIRLVLE